MNSTHPFYQAYKAYQVELAVVGFGAPRALAETEMQAALDFETELARVVF